MTKETHTPGPAPEKPSQAKPGEHQKKPAFGKDIKDVDEQKLKNEMAKKMSESAKH